MSIIMKKSVPIALVFITSVIFILEYFVFPAELKEHRNDAAELGNYFNSLHPRLRSR